MDKELKDRVAIVTAAGRGIGKGIAVKLSKEGADVVITDLNFESAKSIIEEIKKNNGRGLAIKADVSEPDDVKRMVEATIKRFGKIDILVNNVSINKPAPIWEVTEKIGT